MATADVDNAVTMPNEENVQAFCELLDQMRVSISAARDVVKTVREK